MLLSSTQFYAQDLDCSKFRTGTFKYYSSDFTELLTIRPNDSTQIDTYPAPMAMKATSHVKWLSDCKYEFEYYKVDNDKFKALIGIKYTIEILKVRGDTITCANLDGNSKPVTSMDLIKIKD